jgi:hypothetical protein
VRPVQAEGRRLIVVDTLRADALGCYGNARVGENGAKRLAEPRRARRGRDRFDAAHSVAPWTIPSLVSMLSGLWPWEHGQNRLLQPCPADRLQLARLFRERGWRTAGVMTNFIATRGSDSTTGSSAGTTPSRRVTRARPSRKALARLLELADEVRASKDSKGEGLFLFAWLFEPHYRYEAHEGLRFGPGSATRLRRRTAGALGRRAAPRSPEGARRARRRRQGVPPRPLPERGRLRRPLDRRLLEGLRKRGLYDDALVVVTADHGEEILDRGWIGHTVTLREELVRVPCIVRLPRGDADGRRGARSTRRRA